MNKPGEISLKDAIEKLLTTYKIKHKIIEVQLNEKWAEIVGPMISKHTTSVHLKNGKLIVRLDSAVVRQELIYARTKLRDKINKELGGDYVQELELL